MARLDAQRRGGGGRDGGPSCAGRAGAVRGGSDRPSASAPAWHRADDYRSAAGRVPGARLSFSIFGFSRRTGAGDPNFGPAQRRDSGALPGLFAGQNRATGRRRRTVPVQEYRKEKVEKRKIGGSRKTRADSALTLVSLFYF